MLQIICCDDNVCYLQKFAKFIEKICKKHSISYKFHSFISGDSLLFFLKDEVNFADIIFLDVLMADRDGISTANELRKLYCKSEIVFVTSSPDYALKSFDAHPLYYLIKNQTKFEKFEEVFLLARDNALSKKNRSFCFEASGKMQKIELDKITYFEVSNRIITINTTEGELTYYGKIEELDEQLSPKGFARIHRSILVNLDAVCSVSSKEITLCSGEILPCGEKYIKDFKTNFSKFLQEPF